MPRDAFLAAKEKEGEGEGGTHSVGKTGGRPREWKVEEKGGGAGRGEAAVWLLPLPLYCTTLVDARRCAGTGEQVRRSCHSENRVFEQSFSSFRIRVALLNL